jgi:hypothetical protein
LHIERWYVVRPTLASGFSLLFCLTLSRLYLPELWILIICHSRAFDVELLYIAEALRIPIDEVAVYWTEIEGNARETILSSATFRMSI